MLTSRQSCVTLLRARLVFALQRASPSRSGRPTLSRASSSSKASMPPTAVVPCRRRRSTPRPSRFRASARTRGIQAQDDVRAVPEHPALGRDLGCRVVVDVVRKLDMPTSIEQKSADVALRGDLRGKCPRHKRHDADDPPAETTSPTKIRPRTPPVPCARTKEHRYRNPSSFALGIVEPGPRLRQRDPDAELPEALEECRKLRQEPTEESP